VTETTLTAHRIGDIGFASFVRALYRLGVVDRDEWLEVVELHRHVMIATLPPLDTGNGCDDQIEALAEELGAEVPAGGNM
jgi:hypothetical protein